MTATLPTTQHAIQLVGPGKLALNTAKPVPKPAAHEILLKVQAVGLCFSDLKLLKQFDGHPRKGEVLQGLESTVLTEIQSYVPNGKPTVPGHEVVVEVAAIGSAVKHHKPGERYLVQADWRDLPTSGSNAAFGYNFEGGLQEYVIVDERIVVSKTGERFLLPIGATDKGAAALALVEPWACVEDSYVNRERASIKAGGRLLVVGAHDRAALQRCFAKEGAPAEIVAIAPEQAAAQKDASFDDIVYFGADKAVIEALNDKLAAKGTINIVLGGRKIGAPVNVGVGRVHYGLTRWIGTTGADPAESYKVVPATGEIRAKDRILILGAAGPMGQMHVIRDIVSGLPGVSVVGTDFDDSRIESLRQKVEGLAKKAGVPVDLVNPQKTPVTGKFSYFALMAPVAQLVAQCIQDATDNAIINIFAGIPAPVKHELDLDAYIAKKCFMFGTSGSTTEDMSIVLSKVKSGALDTLTSVDAVSGMAGAQAGIDAVENRTLAGKIIVYPQLHALPLTPLKDLAAQYPTVAAKLVDGKWTKAAEEELLKVAR